MNESKRNSTTHVRRILAALALTIVVSGCASDDTQSADTARSSDGTQSAVELKDFQAEGNQICSDLSAELQQILDDNAGSTLETAQQLDAARAASFDALFELQPPPGSEDDFAELQVLREEMAESSTARIPEPDADLRLGFEWEAAASRLGLGDCT